MQHTLITLLAWLATYLIHSTLLLGGALLVARAVRGPAVREVLWKGALLGGLVTATLHGALAPHVGMGRFDLPLVRSAGQATIALQLEGEAAVRGAVTAIGPPTPRESRTGGAQARSTPEDVATHAVVPARWPGLIAVGWALGVLVLATSFLGERRRMSRLFAARRPVRERAPRKALAQLLARAGCSRRVRLTTCPGIGSPVALGSSEICLPERAGSDLSLGELEALMAHELAHLERRDSAWLTAIHVLELMLFPQPLNRIVRRRLQLDVEILCDDSATRRLGEPAELARCLARVAEWLQSSRVPALATGMAHSPSQLVARVERLLAPRTEPRRGAGTLAALGMGLVLTAIGFAGPGVVAPTPPVKQDTPAQARLLTVVASMRTIAERPVVYYRMGEFETTELANLGRHIGLLRTQYPEARIAITPHVAAGSLTALVDEIFEHFDAILVDGEGPERTALRAQVVRQRPVRLKLVVVRSGLRVDAATGRPASGDGKWTYDDTRLIEYDLGHRRLRLARELREFLREEHARRPDARVRLESSPGTIYADVVATLDDVLAAGFTNIGFIGAGANSITYLTIEPVEEVLEEVELAKSIEEVETDSIETLELDAEGRIRVEGALLHDPTEPDASSSRFRTWLAAVAAGMAKAPARAGPKSLLLPDETLLINADPETDFRYVQRVMELCGRAGVLIWKIELAAPSAGVDLVPIWLPSDPGVVGEESPILNVSVRVLDVATDHGRLEYSIGPFKTIRLEVLRSDLARLRLRRSDLRLVIDPRNGTKVIEILRLLQTVRAEGYGPISFVGARPEGVR